MRIIGPLSSPRKYVPLLLAAGVGVFVLYEIWHWGPCRVFVPPDEALLVINKFGAPRRGARIVVPADEDHYKGVRQVRRGPGGYFITPIEHDGKLVPLVEIPGGEPQKWAFDAEGRLKDQ